MLHTRLDRGVEWIWFLDRRGTARQVKRAFTNLTKPDDFLQPSLRRILERKNMFQDSRLARRCARGLVGTTDVCEGPSLANPMTYRDQTP
jgi:hypothetical protein